MSDEKDRIMAAGMDGFVAKPVNRTSIETRVSQALAGGGARSRSPE
jgi:DNA-binding NarL/FixJ family response regulator